MNVLTSEKAEAEVIGHVIILGITILGVSMIALYGVPAIYSLQDIANVKSAEQAFTVFDSRTSRAILGESPLQITNINLGGGTLTVEPNSTDTKSYMAIKSKNDTFNVIIPMGKIKYQLGDRIVAYEGGGVWSNYPTGGSVMLSPPEFHYNGVTLTLPAMSVGGNASVGGKGTATVSIKKKATVVQYPNSSFANRTNPINSSEAGKVYVNITSDYYDAWADYAESLGYTIVSANSTTRTTSIELTVVPATLGSNADITNPIVFRGLDASDGTPLENFSFKIYGKSPGQFLDWDIRAKSGSKTLIFYIKDTSLTIGYQDEGYSSSAETWGTLTYAKQTDSDGEYIDVDLLNTSLTLNYSNQIPVGSNSACLISRIQQPGSDFNLTDFSWDNIIINTSVSNPNRTQSLYNITQHYFWKMAQEGDISFSQCDSGSLGTQSASTMLINYNTTGALTYMHITENRADVGIS